jgi:hypothetical protein
MIRMHAALSRKQWLQHRLRLLYKPGVHVNVQSVYTIHPLPAECKRSRLSGAPVEEKLLSCETPSQGLLADPIIRALTKTPSEAFRLN